MQPILIDNIDGFRVVRDDGVLGGTKARVIHNLFDYRSEYVYAGPCQGYAQVALAYACRDYGKKATLFCAKRKNMHPRTAEALAAGAKIMEVPNGYLSVVRARASEYCFVTGAVMLPFGLYDPRMIEGIAAVACRIDPAPTEVWSVAGSGTLSLALQRAWPDAEVHAVMIGKKHDQIGRARLHIAPERYEQDAKKPPPFASCSNYDAKMWRFVKQYASKGALVWNVAG